MTTQPITCTWHEAEILDLTEAIMIADWRANLLMEPRPTHPGAYQQRAEFVASLITAAVNFDPRFGLPLEVCDRHGCSNLVDANARRDDDRLYCSDDHADEDAQASWEDWQERLLEAGADVRRSPSYDIDPMTGRWAS